jgi:hypothetical protein
MYPGFGGRGTVEKASPKCREAEFCDLRVDGVLRSSALYLCENFTNALRTGYRPRISFVWRIWKGGDGLGGRSPHRVGSVLVGRVRAMGNAARLGLIPDFVQGIATVIIERLSKRAHAAKRE